MPRFFVEQVDGTSPVITGPDAAHIARSLRMRAGETLTLCDRNGEDYLCEITVVSSDTVALRVLEHSPCRNEPSCKITLFQALPKGDKMEWIVQKAVELGVYEIVPVQSARCVSRPDSRAAARKVERWQKIAEEAAKQCERGVIPRVGELIPFEEAVRRAGSMQKRIVFYEGGGEDVGTLIDAEVKSAAIFIGPEGGFEEAEVEAVLAAGGSAATLGPRILRAETAPLAALSVLMFATGNMK